jgi:transglutaminase-like putative cysteine protease
MFFRLTLSTFLILLAASATFATADAPPAWLQQAAAASAPAYEKDVPAVVLLNDQKVTVGDDGRVITTRTYAVRVLTREGRDFAFAREIYETDTGKVREIRAWLLRPAGPVKNYGKDETVDVALTNDDVYNEYRVKAISAKDEATVGSVFGYEIVSEDRSIFSQYRWEFQERIPSLLSRFTLSLPNGWRATSVTFNHDKIQPKVEGSSYIWELRDSPPIEPEPMSPALSNLAPRIAVSYFPPAGSTNAGVKTFADWAAVAAWMSELEDPQVTVNDALAAKARELTANAKTEWEKIQAIGGYVQSVKYISIQIGVGTGGGYRPHTATEVFAKSYGDCKDKANLMRAMLKVVGITSYPVSIFSGDPDYVRDEWPSPWQFNHCIIAIRLSDDTKAQPTIEDARLGRLLIFDPTAEETPVGDLPSHLQGSLALIDSKDSNALVKMPVAAPESNLLDRQVDATIDIAGSLSATIREDANGQWASSYRREFKSESTGDFAKRIQGWISSTATAAVVDKVEPVDTKAGNHFNLNVSFVAPRYAQLMQGRLLVFKPAIVSRRDSLPLSDSRRQQPVVLPSRAYQETVRVKLPAGFDIDEMPDAVKLDTPFGSYATTYEVKEGNLIFTRKLVQKASTIPAEQYNSVRIFFEKIRAAEQAPVVLAKK